MPFHLFGLGIVFAQVLALHAVFRSQQVLAEILVALAARTQEVRAPDKHIARPVLGRIGVLAAHLQRAVFQSLDHKIFWIHAGGFGLLNNLDRIGFELRGAWQPAHAFGANVVVNRAAGKLALVC